MEKDAYQKLLTEKITQKYKPSNEKTVDKINEEFATIAGKLNLSEKNRFNYGETGFCHNERP